MKSFEAIIETKDGGYITALSMGGPFPSFEEAKSYATHQLDLATRQAHSRRADGVPFRMPFGGGGTGTCTAYTRDARCKYGIKTPDNCTIYG